MAESSTQESSRSELILHTVNPAHECELKWIIENVSKFSRRLRSSNFPFESQCKPALQLIAKFNERRTGVTNVNIGIQRNEDDGGTVYLNLDVSLLNENGDLYRRKELTFTTCSNGSPCYFFSELFSGSTGGLTIPTSISYNDDNLFAKGLVASCPDIPNVYILPNDVLVIKAVLKAYGCCVITNTVSVPSPQEELTQITYTEKLLDDLKVAFENGVLTDAQLKVGEERINAHRFILSARSPVFQRMFENDMREKEDGTIHVEDVDFSILEAFVWYLYTGSIRNIPWEDMCGLYGLADKYEVFCLQKACAQILKTLISEKTVCKILVLAYLHNDDGLKKKSMEFINQNFPSVKQTMYWESIIKDNPTLASDVLQIVSAGK